VVIGGGAVLDLGAFAASLYRRGMPLVLVPTTLLSMCDATLGGKTAVDAEISGRLVKNFAGTFYPAQAVWISMEFLRSLPERERLSGAGEVLKTLWIRGKSWDREALADFVRYAKISKSLGHLVRDCLVLKGKVVERDPLDEKRIREVLNFGHTVGHALEALSDLSHGECVLWGMAVESSLLGSRGAQMLGECAWAIREFGLAFPQQFKSVSREEWIGLLAGDKKSKGGAIEMSLLERPGRVVKKRFAPDRIVQAIKDFPKSFPLEGRHQRE
jgi:3-dehydroquinate synthase